MTPRSPYLTPAKLSIEGLPQDWLFPTTRYRGSKRKILPWLWNTVKDLQFDRVLDLFGGTGVTSILFKRMGKQVTYNDYLRYNHMTGLALVENQAITLTDEDLTFILSDHPHISYENFISETFGGYYFLDDENEWLDQISANIRALSRLYSGEVLKQKQAIVMWCLGQACLIKRPFNLFHRRNLNLRTRQVKRSFGNKSTWETPFPVALRRFAAEANRIIFNNGQVNTALCLDAFDVEQVGYDLVYLDPPYFSEGQSDADYRDLYHFLEGLILYEKWSDLIDRTSYNLRLRAAPMRWPSRSPDALRKMYAALIDRFKDSAVVISHKSLGLVPVDVLEYMLKDQGKSVTVHRKPYTYALNKSNGKPQHNIEYLIVGK